MLVCLQFDSIGRRKRQDGRLGTRQVQCTSASHGIPDDVAAVHVGLRTRRGTHSRRVGRPRVAHGSSLGSLRPERRLPAPSQGSSLLGSVRIFGRITHNPETGLRDTADTTSVRVGDDSPGATRDSSSVQVRLSSLGRRTVANRNRLKACACSLGRDSDRPAVLIPRISRSAIIPG